MRNSILLVAVGLLWLGGVCLAAEEAPEPAENIAAFTAAIEAAKSVDEAAAAYAKGCTIDRQNVQLNRAYMVRLLELKNPSVANYPAQVLAKVQPDNATAWAVLTYNAGKNRQYGKAFKAILRCEGGLGDVAAQEMLGQLLAWYDSQGKPPALSEEETACLKGAREAVDLYEPAADAYQRVKDAYDKRKALVEERKAKLEGMVAEIRSIQQRGRELGDQVKQINNRIDDRWKIIRDWKAELDDPESDAFRKNTLRQNIREAQREIDTLKDERSKAQREMQKEAAAFKRAKAQYTKLDKSAPPAVATAKLMHWTLPSPEGPASSQPASTSAPATMAAQVPATAGS